MEKGASKITPDLRVDSESDGRGTGILALEMVVLGLPGYLQLSFGKENLTVLF